MPKPEQQIRGLKGVGESTIRTLNTARASSIQDGQNKIINAESAYAGHSANLPGE
jgi:hypothetical protein